MALFLQAKNTESSVFGNIRQNAIVNLDRVTTITKSDVSDKYAIRFDSNCWFFDSKEIRDEEYNRILKIIGAYNG